MQPDVIWPSCHTAVDPRPDLHCRTVTPGSLPLCFVLWTVKAIYRGPSRKAKPRSSSSSTGDRNQVRAANSCYDQGANNDRGRGRDVPGRRSGAASTGAGGGLHVSPSCPPKMSGGGNKGSPSVVKAHAPLI